MKNLFVVVPLVFSKQMMDPQSLLQTAAAFFLFCLLSGSVYLVNDIFDIEKDRAHPKKCLRPIPSGQLPLPAARTAAALLIVFSLGFSLMMSIPFFATASGYLVLNLAYSLALKHIAFIDVLSIAGGFILRVEAGAVAIGVAASPWLLLCTFTLAGFLGFGKRAHELASAGERAREQRAVLSQYNLSHLRVILWVMAVSTCAAYVLYTISPTTQAAFGTDRLLYTAPFAVFGVIRFISLVGNKASADSPTEEMLRDLPFMINLVLCGIAFVSIIYFL